MFLLVSVRHVGAHPGEHQHGVSIQISISLGKTFLRISRIRNIPLTWILAKVFVYVPPFISQILDFICWTVLIFILIYFEWRDTKNQQFKSRMCNLTFEFILHLHSFFRCFFVLFLFPLKVCMCCRPKYWPNIIHRFDDKNSLTSKCIENRTLFERLTHCQRSALSAARHAPGPPPPLPSRGFAQRKALARKPALFLSSLRMRI